ncbi:hypothetical protein [Acidovorax sp. FG27]|uniref:hypothetical protein n=1 Tax=Acidovorax sp. FG27 TaxID=3133652 RepID=UPI0030E828B8
MTGKTTLVDDTVVGLQGLSCLRIDRRSGGGQQALLQRGDEVGRRTKAFRPPGKFSCRDGARL